MGVNKTNWSTTTRQKKKKQKKNDQIGDNANWIWLKKITITSY